MNSFTRNLTKLVVVVVAIAAVGGGTAIAAKMITGKQIKNGTVTGKDLRAQSVATKHLNPAAAAALKGAAGAQGPKGETGPQGPQGERGPSTAFVARAAGALGVTDVGSSAVQSVSLPAGSYVLQAKATILNAAKDTVVDCELGTLVGDQFTQLDQVDGIDLDISGTPFDSAGVALMGAVTLANAATTVELRCKPDVDDALSVRDRTIVATQVAEVK